MHQSVMPATASPAPRSKSVSVREGTSETTRRGGASKRCSRPRTSRTMRVFYASVRLLQIWAAVAAIALAIHLGGFPLLDPDEGRNAEVGREMALTNDYVMPRLDGLPYLDKPIVYFAAEAAAMEVLGPTEVAARLPAFVFTLLTALLVFLFAKKVWSEESAYIAAIAFLSMPL